MIEFIKHLFKGGKKQCNIQNIVCSASSEKKQNPYELIWYMQGWSKTRVKKNNTKYWQWEINYNGFNPR